MIRLGPKLTDATHAPAYLLGALVLVALVPAVGVLWFMTVAMRNERLAVQEQLAEVYTNHLTSLQARVAAFVNERQAALGADGQRSPSEKFAALVRANLADGVIIYDAAGKVLYPNAASGASSASENAELARALQSRAAALLQAGQKEEALAKLVELVGDARWRSTVGAGGALMVPNAQLLILKTLALSGTGFQPVNPKALRLEAAATSRAEAPRYSQTLDDLVARLNDYSDGALLSNQRRFLMREVRAPAPQLNDFPTFAAEELAAEYLEHEAAPPTAGTLQRTPLAKVWRLPSADRTVMALFREERLAAEIARLLEPLTLPDVRVSVFPPGAAPTIHQPIAPQDIGELLAGWRLGLSFRDRDPLAEASARQTRFYLWAGFGVVLIVGAVALLVARYVAAQVRLARLKNELVSTVSHELKTPLASMRALVDTLAAGRVRDEAQLRDYLQLIATENQRLCQLIENFLAFSRMERGKQRFQFETLAPGDVVRAAVGVLREKLEAPGCQFELRLPPDLPRVRGDAGALATVLVNLLDNACKYTSGAKRIAVQACANGRHVWFEVEDNGIGLASGETRKIFERFYQVDQSLTRQRGGCGLGLSIVKFIVDAHNGTVEVESAPGKGSTFRVRIPVADEKPGFLSQRTQSPEGGHRVEGVAP